MPGIRLRFPLLVLVIILIATSRTGRWDHEICEFSIGKEDGLPELYSEKIIDSTTKATRKIGVFKSDDTMLPKAIKHDPFKKNNGKQHLDAVTEMINMLNKDYQAKAHRRPPINNRSPLKDDADHVKH